MLNRDKPFLFLRTNIKYAGGGERKREFEKGQNMMIEVRRQRDKSIFRKEDEKK